MQSVGLFRRFRSTLCSWCAGDDFAATSKLSRRRPFNLDEAAAGAWQERAEAAVALWRTIDPSSHRATATPREWSIVDLGCGDERLARLLRAGDVPVHYQGYDLLPQTPTSRQLDLAVDFPPGRVDMTFALGLLEYLPNLNGFFARLRGGTRHAVVSYVVADSGAYRAADWAQRGWLHHYTSGEVTRKFAAAGLVQVASEQLADGRTTLWLLKSDGS